MAVMICPHCEAKANFSCDWRTDAYSDLWEYIVDIQLWICDSCHLPVAAASPKDAEEWTYWPIDTAGKKFPDVSAHIAEAATEAHISISANMPRAAVTMARATIEALSKTRVSIMENSGRRSKHFTVKGTSVKQ
jgi:hypothetical protein